MWLVLQVLASGGQNLNYEVEPGPGVAWWLSVDFMDLIIECKVFIAVLRKTG